MKITPLQWLLLNKILPHQRVRQVTGRDRVTVWRWAKGKSYPETSTAEQLIQLFEAERLDFNGCYEASRVISEDEARALGLLDTASETPAA